MQTRILLAAVSFTAVAVHAQTISNTAVFRIDPEVQRQRDQTRVAILQDELVAEALALSEAQRLLRIDLAKSDVQTLQEASRRAFRHRQNISALAKELALVERQSTSAGNKAASPALERSPSQQLNAATPTPHQAVPASRASLIEGQPEWVISGSGRSP